MSLFGRATRGRGRTSDADADADAVLSSISLMEYLNGCYREHVAGLVASFPVDQAMSLAIGGDWDAIGALEVGVLRLAGFRDEHDLLDIGCGSGRLAKMLERDGHVGAYLGIDVVPQLIDHARTTLPPRCRFAVGDGLSVDAEPEGFDFACMFSVATHLPFEAVYLLLEQCTAALRPGGSVVVSFLEFADPRHMAVWDSSVATFETARVHNQFIHREDLAFFGERVGLQVEGVHSGDSTLIPVNGTHSFDDGTVIDGTGRLGQSWMVFSKPVSADPEPNR